ncbi:DUF2892 domain-containing protein [bacterium]|nr:DUF2892 domain-containing protein [bacterium]
MNHLERWIRAGLAAMVILLSIFDRLKGGLRLTLMVAAVYALVTAVVGRDPIRSLYRSGRK